VFVAQFQIIEDGHGSKSATIADGEGRLPDIQRSCLTTGHAMIPVVATITDAGVP
jgi:hypothetical protein